MRKNYTAIDQHGSIIKVTAKNETEARLIIKVELNKEGRVSYYKSWVKFGSKVKEEL